MIRINDLLALTVYYRLYFVALNIIYSLLMAQTSKKVKDQKSSGHIAFIYSVCPSRKYHKLLELYL